MNDLRLGRSLLVAEQRLVMLERYEINLLAIYIWGKLASTVYLYA